MQWHEVEKWASQKIESCRNQNDGDLSDIETAKLRGRIAVLKELLALPDKESLLVSQAKFVQPQGLINSVDW
jgi:hypothetical protein